MKLKKINAKSFVKKSKWGFFYELDINKLQNIKHLIKKKLQTITYFGYSKKFLEKFFSENNFNGIDRIVPIGQALELDFIWDGYDINKTLTRIIDVK